MSETAELGNLLRRPEQPSLAFVASSTAHDDVARHVCAMLNGDGGIVVIGVKDGRPVSEAVSEKETDALRAHLQRHVSIATAFPADRLARESMPQYPFNALREGLVNALVHREYSSFSGGLSVSVYPDRIEIWNSGRFPEGITVAELRRATHASILVNPDISLVFYLHELMERVGRGTFKIVQECRDFGMRSPEWSDKGSGVRLTFHALSARGPVVACLNQRQLALVHDLKSGAVIRVKEYLARWGREISERQARRDLSGLDSAGYLERRGATTATVYVRTEKSVAFGHSAISGHSADIKERRT